MDNYEKTKAEHNNHSGYWTGGEVGKGRQLTGAEAKFLLDREARGNTMMEQRQILHPPTEVQGVAPPPMAAQGGAVAPVAERRAVLDRKTGLVV